MYLGEFGIMAMLYHHDTLIIQCTFFAQYLQQFRQVVHRVGRVRHDKVEPPVQRPHWALR